MIWLITRRAVENSMREQIVAKVTAILHSTVKARDLWDEYELYGIRAGRLAITNSRLDW